MYLLVDDDKNDDDRLFVLRTYSSLQSLKDLKQLNCLNGDLASYPGAQKVGSKKILCSNSGTFVTATIYQTT